MLRRAWRSICARHSTGQVGKLDKVDVYGSKHVVCTSIRVFMSIDVYWFSAHPIANKCQILLVLKGVQWWMICKVACTH